MTAELQRLRAFLAHPELVLVEVSEARGSTPRDAGAWMLVSSDAIYGTIGGGHLEFMAIDEARRLLAVTVSSINDPIALSIPLGPEIGQCCGGRVELGLLRMSGADKDALLARAEFGETRLPHVYLFGGGHVGHALAAALSLLPVRAIVVETRAEELKGIASGVETRLVAMPEGIVSQAPAGSAFLILTHDHALDFLIVAEALKRSDAAYIGMIGSKTKKATFKNWYLKNAGGDDLSFARLVSPIGGDQVKDKRPAVIAALAAAEVMTAVVKHAASQLQDKSELKPA